MPQQMTMTTSIPDPDATVHGGDDAGVPLGFVEREHLFNYAVWGSGDGLFSWDLRTNTLWWSERCAEIFGVSSTEVTHIGDWQQRLHPEDRDRCIAHVQHCIDTGAPYFDQYRIRHADGSYLWLEGRANIERDCDGRPLRMSGGARDINAQKEREKLLEFAIKGSRDGVFVWNIKTDELWWSERYGQMLGIPAHHIKARRDWEALLHPDDRDRVIDGTRRYVSEGVQFREEFRLRHADGHYVWVVIRADSERDVDGTPLRIIGMITDVSKRREKEESLRIAHELAQHHVQNTPLVYMKVDPELVVEDWSGRATEVFGWQREEVIGKRLDEIGIIPPQRVQHVIDKLRGLVARGEGSISELGENQNRHGSPLSIEWFNYAVSNGDGTASTILSFGLDRSPQITAERALALSEERLNLAIRGTQDGLYDWNIETGQLWVSPRYAESLGCNEREPLSTVDEFYARVHPEDRPWVHETLRQGIKAAQPFSVEYRIRGQDGKYLWHLCRGEGVAGSAGIVTRLVGTVTDVTQRREKEEELKTAHRLAQHHIQQSPLAYIRLSPDGVIEEWSRRSEEMFGWQAAEVIGRSIRDLQIIPANAVEIVVERFERLRGAPGSPVREFSRNQTRDGRVLDIEWFDSALTDADGKVIALFAYGLDRTLEMQAERARQLSEERLNLAIRATQDGIYDWNVADGETWVSPRYMEILGYAEGELEFTIEEFRTRLHPDDRALVDAALVRHFKIGDALTLEYRIRGRDGGYIWHLARGKGVCVAEGKVTRLVGTVTDITERKRWEQSLAESERRFRAIADTTPMIIWLAAPDSSLTYINQQALTYTGRRLPELSGDQWSSCIHPDDLPRVRATLLTGLDTRTRFAMEFRLRNAAGDYRWFSTTGLPRFDDDGGFTGFLGTMYDIDDQKQAWAALETANRELLRSNTELEQFAYVASHDLQEPLRMVASFTQLLSKRYRGRLDHEADEFIGYAVDGAKRMQRLINDLLVYSRVGRAELKADRVDMNQLVADVCRVLRGPIEDASAVVTYDPLPCVMGDGTQLAQILQNLIANGIKYHADGRIPRVHVAVTVTEHALEFCVSDNGIGFDPQYAERIFVIFQRLHSRAQYPGTGIGLSIVKKITERHGGTVRADSRPGEGANFYFTLPRWRSAEPGALLLAQG